MIDGAIGDHVIVKRFKAHSWWSWSGRIVLMTEGSGSFPRKRSWRENKRREEENNLLLVHAWKTSKRYRSMYYNKRSADVAEPSPSLFTEADFCNQTLVGKRKAFDEIYQMYIMLHVRVLSTRNFTILI